MADLPARELDRLAQTTEGHASLIESGVVKNVTLETAGKLAWALGVTIDWLVNGSGEPPTVPSVQAAVEAARDARAARIAKDAGGERAANDAAKPSGTEG